MHSVGQGRSSALEKCRQARRGAVPVPGVKPAGRGGPAGEEEAVGKG